MAGPRPAIRQDKRPQPPPPRGAFRPTALGPPRSTASDARPLAAAGRPVARAAPGPFAPWRTGPVPQRPVRFHMPDTRSPRPPTLARPRRASRTTPRPRGPRVARKTLATVPGRGRPLPATLAGGPGSPREWQAGWRPAEPGHTVAVLAAAAYPAASPRRLDRSRQVTCAAPKLVPGPRPLRSSAGRRRWSVRSSPTAGDAAPAAPPARRQASGPDRARG